MKKVIGFLMIVIPIAILSIKVAVYLNNGIFNIATAITMLVIGSVYLLVAMGLYDSDD